MKVPWLRRNFLARRKLDRLVLDLPDALFRSMTGRLHEPPYSLRAFVGGAHDFDEVGRGFIQDLKQLNLLSAGSRILDIGCGSGRLARPLALDRDLQRLEVTYFGMDIDRRSIDWCQRNIAALDQRFSFYHADCYNASYNRRGLIASASYRFPHPNGAFDLILLTSVLTHLVADELERYLSEIARLLAPDGAAYCSLFLYRCGEEAESERYRRPISFPFRCGKYAIHRHDFPANAVAYSEDFFLEAIHRAGLTCAGPVRYGLQDLAILVKQSAPSNGVELGEGWHELENESWRWTGRVFQVRFTSTSSEASILRFRFRIPDALLASCEQLRLSATAGCRRLEPGDYTTPGSHVYIRRIPVEVFVGKITEVCFELNSALRPLPDQRELGVQAAFWTYSNGERRPSNPLKLMPPLLTQ